MIVLGANPEGSQFDFKILPNGNQDDYDLSYETKASKHDNAYHVELVKSFLINTGTVCRTIIFRKHRFHLMIHFM